MSYNLESVETTPFDTYPEYPAGPPTVTFSGTESWAVSYKSLDRVFSSRDVIAKDDGLVTLSVHRNPTARGGAVYDPDRTEYHPLHGTEYATRREATRAAYDAGLLAFFHYSRETGEPGA